MAISIDRALSKQTFGDTALTESEPALPLPPYELATSLERAPPRSFVFVDSSGQVRSPTYYRAVQTASWILTTSTVAAFTLLAAELFGALGIGLGLAAMIYVIWLSRRVELLKRAASLLVHDRLEESEVLLHTLASSWPCPPGMRAGVEQHLGALSARRGRFDDALTHFRRAGALHHRGRRGRRASLRAAQYSELATLVNLGRLAEARSLLDRLAHPTPRGDWLRVQHQTAELYLCMAEGGHEIDADELHDRARRALSITTAAALLGLLAWAHLQLGDVDQAGHLLREARDRRAGLPLDKTMPLLHRWMEEHAGLAAGGADY